MIKFFRKIRHYRNLILHLQNQMSYGHLVEIAACGKLKIQ
jgi:hypothetical protein